MNMLTLSLPTYTTYICMYVEELALSCVCRICTTCRVRTVVSKSKSTCCVAMQCRNEDRSLILLHLATQIANSFWLEHVIANGVKYELTRDNALLSRDVARGVIYICMYEELPLKNM